MNLKSATNTYSHHMIKWKSIIDDDSINDDNNNNDKMMKRLKTKINQDYRSETNVDNTESIRQTNNDVIDVYQVIFTSSQSRSTTLSPSSTPPPPLLSSSSSLSLFRQPLSSLLLSYSSSSVINKLLPIQQLFHQIFSNIYIKLVFLFIMFSYLFICPVQ